MKSFLIGLIRIYRLVFSAVLHFICGPGFGCRHCPTCSEYLIEAIQRHGSMRGLLLGAGRMLRCHPWGGCGYDPVPIVLKKSRRG